MAQELEQIQIFRDFSRRIWLQWKFCDNISLNFFLRSKDFDDVKRLASTLDDDESKEALAKLLRDKDGLEAFLDDQETRLNIGNYRV